MELLYCKTKNMSIKKWSVKTAVSKKGLNFIKFDSDLPIIDP